jgi:hypothetical protein
MVSRGLPLAREIEPVVNLLVPQPATLAASAIMNAVVISRFPVAFVMHLIGIGTGPPVLGAAVERPSFLPQKYSVNPNGQLRTPTRKPEIVECLSNWSRKN